jgi:hypothetical protein
MAATEAKAAAKAEDFRMEAPKISPGSHQAAAAGVGGEHTPAEQVCAAFVFSAIISIV